jgi:lysophospholipase L1-like esterase
MKPSPNPKSSDSANSQTSELAPRRGLSVLPGLLFCFAVLFAFTARLSAGDLERLAAKDSPLKDSDRIVFFGDSITQFGSKPDGYVTLFANELKKSGKTTQVINSGVCGNRVPNLQQRLQKSVLNHKPTIVWIFIGINDVGYERYGLDKATPKPEFEAGLRDIIGQIQKAGAIVVLATPSVIGEKKSGNRFDAKLDEYAEVSRAIAKDTGSTFCDLRKAFKAELEKVNTKNTEKGVLTEDEIHLNAAGNVLVANQSAAAILAAAAARNSKRVP